LLKIKYKNHYEKWAKTSRKYEDTELEIPFKFKVKIK